ncbi:ANTAR domain-containing protein [Peptococcaceae bacterium 1198_IL3148]
MSAYRVILIDANDTDRKNLKAILSKYGYLLIGEATDGITAIKMLRSRQPDLIIIDTALNGMNGLEVAQILSEDRIAPIFLTSSDYKQELLNKALEAKVQGLLIKPIEESHLISTLEVALLNYNEMIKLEQRVKEMQDKLESRKIIEKAKGILMKTMGLNEEQAFKKLQKQSMNKRISMKAMAEAVIMAENLKGGI